VRRVRTLALPAAGLLLAGCSAAGHHVAARTTATAPTHPRPASLRLTALQTGSLAQPVQDAAAAPANGDRFVLLGGLDAADASTDTVRVATVRGDSARGRLPGVLHDAAAVSLNGAAYLFGGGNGSQQLSGIVRVDPRSGAVKQVGTLPAAASDVSAGVIHDTAYVVGGYTGTRWLDTIVAWRPGRAARVVAHLPTPLRYAAVAADGDELVIAGGSTPAGVASRAVFVFRPEAKAVARLGTLPYPTTHAAAASIGEQIYVIGGRGTLSDTPTDRIMAVDAERHRVVAAGRLPRPLSDLAAVPLGGGRIALAGGRDAGGAVSSLGVLVPASTHPNASARSKASAHSKASTHSKSRDRARVANVYAYDGANMLSPIARRARPLIYVPNSLSNTVDEIDPRTFRIVRQFAVGTLPQHVTPSWDLKTLYVLNDLGNSLTAINPRTGAPTRTIAVTDPYNMYFTPDGRYAIVVAERLARLDFRDAHTFRLHKSVHVPCRGIDHMDFSADGSYAIASCEFSGELVKLDVRRERITRVRQLPFGSDPQDVKLSSDGRIFYVADMGRGGVWEIAGNRLRVLGFLRTGSGAHGLYESRNGRSLYVTNRAEGSISVISFRTRRVVRKWLIPGGGSPDMGNVSPDGRVLWLSGRWNNVVYAIDTRNGKLLAKIPVGNGPHGLCVWPQPGRYSLGHTGILR
jgi:YVTN family beta-propeller protein